MTPGLWLFSTVIVYFVVGMFNLFVYKFTKVEYIQPVWLLITALPLYFPPASRWIGVGPIWKMLK